MPTPILPEDAGWMGDRSRGASLGRYAHGEPTPAPVRFYLRRLRLDSGGYDSGGAYWGRGAPLWWACSEDGGTDRYFRARSRDAAKAELRAEFPAARFFR